MPPDTDNTAAPHPSERKPHEHRPVDEYANLVTHGLGLLLSLVASAVLMWHVIEDHEWVTIFTCGIYCLSLVGLYAASTLSHAFYDLSRRRLYRALDQACIFLLIAGSFTPVGVAYLKQGYWFLLTAAIWITALFGVCLVVRMGNLTPAAKVLYGVLGWLPVIAIKPLFDAAPFEMLVWMVAGGAFYSIGTLFLRFDGRVRYFHALWHSFVIAGSTCHYIAILLFVVKT
jgi:hemolysin III